LAGAPAAACRAKGVIGRAKGTGVATGLMGGGAALDGAAA
jgi:hypothetical protein